MTAYQVVDDADAEDLGRFDQAACDVDVLLARHGIAGRMVVSEEDAGRVGLDGRAEDVARVNGATVEQAACDRLGRRAGALKDCRLSAIGFRPCPAGAKIE